jgi:hypothetical protein
MPCVVVALDREHAIEDREASQHHTVTLCPKTSTLAPRPPGSRSGSPPALLHGSGRWAQRLVEQGQTSMCGALVTCPGPRYRAYSCDLPKTRGISLVI